MAWIEGFCGIRYNLQAGRDISDRLAPPYDVIKDQAGKDALLARSQHCIAAIDLPHVPPKTAGPAQAYQRSAELLDQWLETAILVKEATPAIYVYQQRFSNAGQEYIRRGFIARL